MSQDINSIIEQLSEIDSASAKIMKQAQDEKSKYAEYIQQQKQEFDAKLKLEVDTAVAEYEKTLEEQNKEELIKFKEECDNTVTKLDKMLNEKGASLAENIFNNIIKE